jgi:hypothetical protein
MNSRDPIWAIQRAGQKRRQGQREYQEENTIKVEVDRPIRRRQTEVVEGSSPSTRRVQIEHVLEGGSKVVTVRW